MPRAGLESDKSVHEYFFELVIMKYVFDGINVISSKEYCDFLVSNAWLRYFILTA